MYTADINVHATYVHAFNKIIVGFVANSIYLQHTL